MPEDATETIPATSATEGDDNASADATTDFPDERYKGMQRALQAAKDEADRERQENAALRQQQVSQPAASANPSAHDPYAIAALTALKEHDPDAARAIATQMSIGSVQEENKRLKDQANQTQEAQVIADIISRNNEQLRQVATTAGVDPNSELLDYGRDDDPIYDRLQRLNSSIAVAKQTTDVEPETSPVGDATHSLDPGTPLDSSGNDTFTMADLDAAKHTWEYNQTPENQARMRRVQVALERQILS